MPLILASDLLRLPVASVETNSRVGSIELLLIDIDRSLVIGFLVTMGLFSQPKFLALQDVQSIDRNGVVIRALNDLAHPGEVVRAKKILEQKIPIINQLVKNEAGQRLGKVNDLLINTETGEVTKYYIHGWFSDRIISANKIVKITRPAIIVEDEETVKAEPATAVA